MLMDQHCHLDFPELAAELDAVLGRAEVAGIAAMLSISTRVKRLANLLAIAEAHANVFCSVGTHPHYAHEELDVSTEELIRLSPHPKVGPIGEAGLHHFYKSSRREAHT